MARIVETTPKDRTFDLELNNNELLTLSILVTSAEDQFRRLTPEGRECANELQTKIMAAVSDLRLLWIQS